MRGRTTPLLLRGAEKGLLFPWSLKVFSQPKLMSNPCYLAPALAVGQSSLKAILEKLDRTEENSGKVVKATERMEKTLLEATCEMGKLRAIQQLKPIPSCFPLEKMETGISSRGVA